MSDLISIESGTLAFLGNAGLISPSVINEFYKDNDEIAKLIYFRVQMRTAMASGALRGDETYEVNHNPDSQDLVVFYVRDDNQISAYGRTYARFIEGPGLGNSSPTIAEPSHMYARIETDDRDLIQAWGQATLGKATDVVTALAGGI